MADYELVNAFPIPLALHDYDRTEIESEVNALLDMFNRGNGKVVEEGVKTLATGNASAEEQYVVNLMTTKKYSGILDYVVDKFLVRYCGELDVLVQNACNWAWVTKIEKGYSRPFGKFIEANFVILMPLECSDDQTIDILNPNCLFESKKLGIVNGNLFNSSSISIDIKDRIIVFPASTFFELKAQEDLVYLAIGICQ